MPLSLSIVIASGAGGDFLFRCLESLKDQAARCHVPVLVVDRVGAAYRQRVQREHPWIKVLAAPKEPRPSVPELRRLGVQNITTDVVLVIEEHCLAEPHWIDTVAQSFTDGDAAIGGPILDDRYSRLRDWTVYFSEYHNYLPPWHAGPRANLNGANIAYRVRDVLAFEEFLADGYWEVVLHPRLAGRGALRAAPDMGARHSGPFDYGYYLGQRYRLSRAWGGSRRKSVGIMKRVAYLVFAPIFPVLLLARIASRVFASGRHRMRFIATLPLLFPVTLAYVFGEWLGYLVGPGRALEEVE